MPSNPQASHRTIQAEPGFLPAPATKLVITQHLQVSHDPPFWAWLIVGAFYDQDDSIIWSTEIFVGHLNIEFESDDETSDTEQSDTDSGSEPETGGASLEEEDGIPAQTRNLERNLQPLTSFVATPPVYWDPTRQGPVPGHWQAAFDPRIRRWVHTWQPSS